MLAASRLDPGAVALASTLTVGRWVLLIGVGLHLGILLTMEIGWFKFVNGSGSKATSKGRSWENLDYDLCNSCTESFDNWWTAGKASE